MKPDDGRSARRYERTSGRIPVDYVIDGRPRSDYVVSLSAGGVFVETEDPQPISAGHADETGRCAYRAAEPVTTTKPGLARWSGFPSFG